MSVISPAAHGAEARAPMAAAVPYPHNGNLEAQTKNGFSIN